MADSLVDSLDWFDRAVASFAETLDDIGRDFDRYIDEVNDFVGFPAVPIKVLPVLHALLGELPKANVPDMAALVESYFGRAETVVAQLESLARRSDEIGELYRSSGSANEFAMAVNRLAQQQYSLTMWLVNYGGASAQMLTTVIGAIVGYQGNLIVMLMEFFWFLASLVYTALMSAPAGGAILLGAMRRSVEIGERALADLLTVGFRKTMMKALEAGGKGAGKAISRRADEALSLIHI